MNLINHFGVFISHFTEDETSCVPVVENHSLTYVYSGEMEFDLMGTQHYAHKGDCVFLRRNHQTQFTKRTFRGAPYKGISITLSRELLKKYFTEHQNSFPKKEIARTEIDLCALPFSTNEALQVLFAEAQSYENRPPTEAEVQALLYRTIRLLLNHDEAFYPTLFDFSAPWKIDLMEFMNHNYQYPLSLTEFAKYTGRSLASFKRDFAKLSNLTPQKWLIQRRLKEAYHRIFDRNEKANEVYLEVGFKDIAHFYHSFKDFYGFVPSSKR
ncbi:hypothetical protein RCZ04_05840 [Capnocytophaga sp. HP1101]